MTARAEAVSSETLARVEREERDALAAPPGADGIRRAVQEHAERWARDYGQEALRHEEAARRAREQEGWWARIAAAASPLRLVPDQAEEVVG